jgi:hypothetical protein
VDSTVKLYLRAWIFEIRFLQQLFCEATERSVLPG